MDNRNWRGKMWRLVSHGIGNLATAVFLIGTCAASGQPTDRATISEPDQWTNALAREVYGRRDAYRPLEMRLVDESKARAFQAMRDLDRFLSQTTPERRKGWKDFLKWSALEQELTTDGVPNMTRLATSYAQFSSGNRGLELAPFANMRDELRTLLERLRMTESEPGRVADERQRLTRVMTEFDRFLRSGGERKEQGWKKYLQWDQLQDLLSQEEPDPRALRRIVARFDEDQAGLRQIRFQRLSQALRKYEDVRVLSRQPAGSERFAARMEQLARAIEEYSHDRTADSAATILSAVNWLEQINQQSDIQQRLRNSFSQPNLIAWVSNDVVAREMQDRVVKQQPVNTCFEGKHVCGTACAVNYLNGRLLPSCENALLEIAVCGDVVTDSVATKRRVHAMSRSFTNVLASKKFIFSEAGLFPLPADVQACTSQNYLGACVERRVGRRIITRLARRKAAESRYRAQAFTSQNTIQSASSRLDQQGSEMAAKVNARLEEFRQRLREERLYPHRMAISSTASHLWLNVVSRDARSFATTTNPPPMTLNGDFGIQLHHSAVNNVLKQRLAGVRLDSDTVVEMMDEYNIEVPDELRPRTAQDGEPLSEEELEEAEDEKWSITFDVDLPVLVTFEDSLVKIGVRGRKFSRGARQVNHRIEIAANYRLLRTTDGHLIAEKVGELEVRYLDIPGRLNTQQMSYKVFLQRKFASLFRDQITTYDLVKIPELARAKDVQLDSIATDSGWLSTIISVRPGVRLRPRS